MDTRPKILSIDNNSANQRLLAAILEPDYEFITALSGTQGLRLLDEEVPDLILLDIDMPGIDGLQTCRMIRANPRFSNTSIIFLSCLCSRDDQLRAFDSGADDFIAKPFDVEILRAKVNAYIQRDRRFQLQASAQALQIPNAQDEITVVHLRQVNHFLLEVIKASSLTRLCELTLDALNKIGLKAALRIHKRPDLTCSSCGPLTDLETSLLSDAMSTEQLHLSARFVLGSNNGALMIQNMPARGSQLYAHTQEALLVLFEAFSLKIQSLLARYSTDSIDPRLSLRNPQQELKQLSQHVERALRTVELQCDHDLTDIIGQLHQLQRLPTSSFYERNQLALVDTRLKQVKNTLLMQCMELEGRCLQMLATQPATSFS